MEATPRYRPSWFVRLFHSRPHWDISFRVVNDTFNLQDELYLESLGIWASAPAAVLILSLIILLFYLLAYCCKRRRAKKHKFGFLRWVLVFFAVLCCGALACAMYGNEAAHSSIVDFVRHVESIDRRASGAKNQTSDVADKLHKDVDPRLSLLRDEFNKREEYGDPRIKMALDDMSKNMTEAKTIIASISARISHVDYSYFATFVTQVESIRWPVTMAVMGLFVLFCLVLLLGIAKRSRCTLMAFSVLGLIATVFTGLLVCAVFVVAMGLSDICWAPDKFVLDHIGTYPPRPIAEFYVMCNPLADNPFEDFVSNGLRATTNIQTSLKLVTDVAEKHDEDKMRQNQQLHANLGKLGQALNATSQSIVKLNEALHCRAVHSDYIHALESGCNRLMYGLTWTLLSVAGACILFYLLVLLDSHLWIYMRKRIYATTEEADPFLPQGQRSGGSQAGSLGRRTNIPMTGSLGPNYRARHFSNTHTPPQTPPFPGTLNGRMNVETDPRYNTYGHNYQPQPHYGYAQGHHHPGAPPVSIATLPGPNHGQYATLSRHCKTLESSSFY